MLMRWVKHGGYGDMEKYHTSSVRQDLVFLSPVKMLYQVYFFAGI